MMTLMISGGLIIFGLMAFTGAMLLAREEEQAQRKMLPDSPTRYIVREESSEPSTRQVTLAPVRPR